MGEIKHPLHNPRFNPTVLEQCSLLGLIGCSPAILLPHESPQPYSKKKSAGKPAKIRNYTKLMQMVFEFNEYI